MQQRVFAFLTALLALSVAIAAAQPPLSAVETVLAPPPPGLTPAQLQRLTPVVRVFRGAHDAVVNISATQIIEMQTPWDRMFQGFFNGPIPGPRERVRATSVGSGFVINSSGYIVTNAHVVARTTERHVIFPDKTSYPARIVAIDTQHDLAVLKIDAPHPLATLPLGRSDDLMVGETAIAIGNPFGYQNTCTAGIVSALGRNIETNNGEGLKGLIQTDASINPGNSGGPLLNILGQLIGINTAIRGDAQNIGFAIPVDQLRDLLPEMLDVERRDGIITGLKVEEYRSAQGIQCIVKSVTKGSPADQPALEGAAVRILSLDGQPVHSAVDYAIDLIGKKPGQTIRLGIQRGDQAPTTVNIVLAARPRPDGPKLLARHLGLIAQELSQRMARAMGLRGVGGLLVDTVEPNGPGASVGIQRGDVIVQLGQHPIRDMAELGDLLDRVTPGQRLSITVLRVKGNMLLRSTGTVQAR